MNTKDAANATLILSALVLALSGEGCKKRQEGPDAPRHRHLDSHYVGKPGHSLAPKRGNDYAGNQTVEYVKDKMNYTSPQGVQYIIVVPQQNYRGPRNIRLGGSVTQGGNYPPKPASAAGCRDAPVEIAPPRVPDLEDVVEDIESAVPAHGRGK
ncbi:MAG TPA: hypothetical protein HA362_01885 [Nanoarchaeota archaeon]|nr:hypothetical protein [Nanoarchaeota archaeon]